MERMLWIDFDPDNVDIYGCTINTLPWQLEVWAKSNGGGYYSEDGSECTIDSPETVEALQRIADLSDVYHCAPPVTSAANALESSLGSKKVVMATDGAWNVGTFLGPSADFDYGVGVLPYMKEKSYYLYWWTKRGILHNRAPGRSYGMAEMVLSGKRIPGPRSRLEHGCRSWIPGTQILRKQINGSATRTIRIKTCTRAQLWIML